jgi:hypothetical protein
MLRGAFHSERCAVVRLLQPLEDRPGNAERGFLRLDRFHVETPFGVELGIL